MFAATVVPAQSRVTLIESSRVAVDDARHNLAGRPADVVRAAVGDWHPDERDAVDVLIADPSRTGLGKPGVATVARCAPAVVVLVSCDPVSLARDTALLAGVGGMLVGGMFAGGFMVETVFGWPGIGYYAVKTILAQDCSAVMTVALIIASIYMLSNLLTDFLYVRLDPRIRYS